MKAPTQRPDPLTIFADAYAEARTLEANGASFSVDRVRELVGQIAAAVEPYTTWLSETDAAIRAGIGTDAMRGKFAAMERDGDARLVSRNVRQYRQSAVARRANIQRAEQAGRDAARSARKSA